MTHKVLATKLILPKIQICFFNVKFVVHCVALINIATPHMNDKKKKKTQAIMRVKVNKNSHLLRIAVGSKAVELNSKPVLFKSWLPL